MIASHAPAVELADRPVAREIVHARRPRLHAPNADTPCPTGRILLEHSCEHGGSPYRTVVNATCKLCVCPDCEATRAADLRARYKPAIERMHNPTAWTLTIANGPDATERRKHLTRSARRLADLRLGARGREHLRTVADAFLDSLAPERLQGRTRDEWRADVTSWLAYVARKDAEAKDAGHTLKFRKLMRGILTMECTNSGNGFHFHLHGVQDIARFMPWPALVAAWTIATRQELHAGAHISAIEGDPTGEAFKYAMKPADAEAMTPDERQAIVNALYCAKRVFTYGGIRPVEPEREPCPNCGQQCKCAIVGQADERQADVTTYPAVVKGESVTVHEYTHPLNPKLGRLWAVVDPSRLIPYVDTNGSGPTTGPPMNAPPGEVGPE